MKLFNKDLDREVAIIAEIGVNHEGDIDKASALMRLAAEAGADAVKFQSYTSARFISADDGERLERVERFRIDEAAHRRLAQEAAELGVVFFSSAITEDVVPLLDELCPAIKIASGDIDFEPVIRACAQTGKPVILSTGTATAEEVDRAVAWFRSEIGDRELREHLALMHCVSAYPVPLEEANLRGVQALADRYGLHTGYSNHVIGTAAVVGAIALGAEIIEVHFTDQKEGRTFRDHQLSFNADDLKYVTDLAQELRAGLGTTEIGVQDVESVSAAAMRKGVVAAKEISSGEVIERNHLMFARPATEYASGSIDELIGEKATCNYRLGETIRRGTIVGN